MISKNSIDINQATMIEAMQEWFSNRWRADQMPRVTRVYGIPGAEGEFRVVIDAGVKETE